MNKKLSLVVFKIVILVVVSNIYVAVGFQHTLNMIEPLHVLIYNVLLVEIDMH